MNSRYKPIDHNKMSSLMESGRGKQKDRLQLKAVPTVSDPTFNPEKVFSKMRDGKKWKNTELAAVTGIDRKTIGKLREGKYYNNKTIGSNSDTIAKIAYALDVDPDYLTGNQPQMRRDPEWEKKRQLRKQRKKDETKRLEKVAKLGALKNFLKLYGIQIEYDDEEDPSIYWLYDSEDDLIRDCEDIDDLNGLITIIFNYLNTGSDIIQLFFGEMWTNEF